jgi:hypothetical protein
MILSSDSENIKEVPLFGEASSYFHSDGSPKNERVPGKLITSLKTYFRLSSNVTFDMGSAIHGAMPPQKSVHVCLKSATYQP